MYLCHVYLLTVFRLMGAKSSGIIYSPEQDICSSLFSSRAFLLAQQTVSLNETVPETL